MKKRHYIFLTALLLAATVLPAATVRLAGYDTNGDAMKFGSGSNGNNYYKPAVSDHPRVAFIAPDPIYAQGPAAEFRASYLIAPLVENPQATLLFAGEFMSFPMPNWQIAGTPDLSACFAIRQFSVDNIQFLWKVNGQTQESPPLDAVVTDASRLTISADGAVAAIGGQTGMLLIDITADEFTTFDLDGTPLASNTGNSIGLSKDGDIVFFASKTLDKDGLTRIYCYERSSNTLETVAVAEADANLLVDAQVVATPDGNTVVFVATNYELWSGSKGDGLGPKIIAAIRQTNGDWTTSPCSIGPYLDASEPSVSTDGRFVAFRARTADNSTYQVFRYDRLTQITTIASAAADGQPADTACEVPSISPNGRYIAFVSKASNFGDNPDSLHHVWLSDLGPTLIDSTLALPVNSSSELPVHLVVNYRDGDTITWSSDTPLPGVITCATGAVDANAPYPVATLPWTFTAGPTPGAAEITITLQQADGAADLNATIALEVFATDVPRQLPVSAKENGHFAPRGGLPLYLPVNLAEDGALAAFATTVRLDLDEGGSDFNKRYIYSRRLNDTTGALTLLTSRDATLQSLTLAGDGNTVFFIAGNNLYTVPTTGGGAPEQLLDTSDVSAVASSYNGTVLALVRDGEAWLRQNGEMIKLGAENNIDKPLLSRDGQTAAFLDSDGNVLVWTAADDAWRNLANDVRHVSMTLDGCTLYCQAESDGALSVITTGTGASTPLPLPGLPDGVTTNNLFQPTISPNRRFLVYFRDCGKIQQLFRYDLAEDAEVMASVSSEGLPGNAYSGVPLSISGAGDRILYATTATNLLPGSTGRELALAVFTDQAAAAPSLRTTAVTGDEAAEIIFPLDCESSFGAAVPTLLRQPLHGRAELLGPAIGRDGYALHFIPDDEHFCGEDSVVIKLFDGSRWSADTTVVITVNNVNDAPTWRKDDIPAEATSYTLDEGEVLTGAPPLSEYADDPDLAYAAITHEKLSFSLVGAPEWLTLDQDDRLATIGPPGYDIARRDQNKVFEFKVRVTDNAGESADLPVSVTVVNVNRPPILTAFPAQITEGVLLNWSDFTLIDPDPEDQDQLRLRFSAPAKGKWVRQADNTNGTEFGEADFPIFYCAREGEFFNTDTAQVRVVDGGNASSAPGDLFIRLRQVNMKMSELWSATGPDALLPGKIPGWALLSVPIDMRVDALRQAFGSALWAWDADLRRYFELTDQVQAGQGFWVLIAEGPILDDAYIQGERPDAPALPAAPGWHLIGPPITDQTPANDHFFGNAPASQSYQQVTTDQIREGGGYWRFNK
ncbi:MAG: hypothetical protein GX937_00030 [Lentisphaerae bacterium]|nr:hypothetical protein [Lentisphaerota bacterium]